MKTAFRSLAPICFGTLLTICPAHASPPAFPTAWFEVTPLDQISRDRLGLVGHTIEAIGMMEKGSESFLAVDELSGRVKFLPIS